MPLMMDDDLDDLFGDAAPLNVPQDYSKGFLQYVDDLRLGGCCQKIAWSKLGCIANITVDGRSVNLRHLSCTPEDGQWRLSKAYPADGISIVHSEHQLAHLSWSHSGSELAIFDVLGQTSIFIISIALNRLMVTRRCPVDPEDSLSAAVGLMWLNTGRMLPLYRPAIKKDGQWEFSCSQHKLMGPQNPNPNKPALVVITRGGMIRLMFQGQDIRWHDLKTDLDSISVSSELLTHAAVCADKDSTMLLATHTMDRQLRLYRVSVDFSQLSLNVQHLKTVNDCSPFEVDSGDSHESFSSYAQITHLELIPPGPETRNRGPTSPFILAAFSYVPDQYHVTQMSEEPFSILARWELGSYVPTLHPSFAQLTSKKSNAPPVTGFSPETYLKRLGNTLLNKLVLSVQQTSLSTVLIMSHSDGSVQFRDRSSLEILPRDEITDQVSSLGQIGFDFPDTGSRLQTALSPNCCALVSLNGNCDVSLELMQIPNSSIGGSIDSSFIEAVTEAFVMQSSIASTSHGNHHDDLLALMQLFSKQHEMQQVQLGSMLISNIGKNFLSEIYRVLGINVDYALNPNPDILRNQMIQRCLSMQGSLGYEGEQKHGSLPAKIAWTILNLRFISLSFAFAFKKPAGAPGAEPETKRPESIRSLSGIASWSMALMNFITDDLFSLATLQENQGSIQRGSLESKIRELNTPALSLVLISSSRSFLRYNCRYMRSLSTEARNAQAPGPQRQAFRELEAIFTDSSVSITQFERMVSDLDNSIRGVYQSSQTSDTNRKNIEKEMLISAEIPEILMPAIETLLTTTVATLKQDVDVAELYFSDISWLGLSDDSRTDMWKKNHTLDAIRKVEVTKGARIRRCTRCCAVMEDILPQKGESMWMLNMQRTCFCGNWWALLGDEVVE